MLSLEQLGLMQGSKITRQTVISKGDYLLIDGQVWLIREIEAEAASGHPLQISVRLGLPGQFSGQYSEMSLAYLADLDSWTTAPLKLDEAKLALLDPGDAARIREMWNSG